MTIFVSTFLSCRIRCVDVNNHKVVSCQSVKNLVSTAENIPANHFKLVFNGQYVDEDCYIPDGSTVHILLSLPGGKGGFGSMLRAIGAQIEKTTNREACRDLSGRRLRDINEEQRLKRWISKRAERERDKVRRRKEKLERLRSNPKHYFQDSSYDKQRSELPERIDSALTQGLQTFQNGETSQKRQKRKCKGSTQPKKKHCLWLGVDVTSDVDDTGSESNNEEESQKPSTSEAEVLSDSSNSNSCETSVLNKENNELPESEPSTSAYRSTEAIDDCLQQNLTHEDSSSSSQSPVASPSEIKENNEDKKIATTSSVPSHSGITWNYSFMKKSTPVAGDGSSTSDTYSSSSSSEESEDEELEHPTAPSSKKVSFIQPADNSCDRKVPSTLVAQLPPPSTASDTKNMSPESLDLLTFNSSKELEELGLDFLKSVLMAKGMKCGGTLQQRAERLWSIRGVDVSKIPPSLLSKPANNKNK